MDNNRSYPGRTPSSSRSQPIKQQNNQLNGKNETVRPGGKPAQSQFQRSPFDRVRSFLSHEMPAQPRPRYEDEGRDSREYARYVDDGWARDRALPSQYSSHRTDDPWSREWINWTTEQLAYYEESDGQQRTARNRSRSEWGGSPDHGTVESVALFVAPPTKRSSQSNGETVPLLQIRRWIASGFAQGYMPSRKAINFLLVLVLIFTGVIGSASAGIVAYSDYTTLKALGINGATALNNIAVDLGLNTSAARATQGSDTISPQQVQAAQADINLALSDFTQLQDRLKNPDMILSVGGKIPKINTMLQSGIVLSQLAIDATIMAQKSLPALVSIAKIIKSSPIAAKGTAQDNSPLLTQADLDIFKQVMAAIMPQITDMLAVLQSTPSDVLTAALPAKYVKDVVPLLSLVPQIPNMLSFVHDFLQIAPTVLGVTTNGPIAYLITTFDNTEIRPAGGFQGQFAIVGVNGGRIGHISIQDVYQFEPKDSSFSNIPSGEYWWANNNLGWSLRNSGLSPDFPQSARYMLTQLHSEQLCTGVWQGAWPYTYCNSLLYNEGNHVPVVDSKTGAITGYDPTPARMAGVIGIQSSVIAQVLAVTGPIRVTCPYNVDVTSATLQQQIHYYQETPKGRSIGYTACPGTANLSDGTKRFTAILTQELLTKLKSMPKTDLFKLVGVVLNDFHTKNIQIYLTDPTNSHNFTYQPFKAGEVFLQNYSDASQTYTGSDDSLIMSQANFAGDKVNQYTTMKLTDVITLGNDSTASHNLTIGYNFNIPPIPQPTQQDIQEAASLNPAPTPMQYMIYNILFNARYDPRYHEYRRLYVNPNAYNISGTGFINNNSPYDLVYPDIYYPNSGSVDIPNHLVIGGYYVYQWDINPDNSVTFHAPSGIQNPTVSWYVPGVINNGVYTLHFQRQSGVTTDYDITVTPPSCSSNKNPLHLTGTLTTDMVISYPVPGC